MVKSLADNHLIMIDLDFARVPSLGPIWAACHIVGLHPRWIRTDRTRHGWHILLSMREALTPGELIALQCICGSDRRRETLNLMRAMAIRQRDPGPFWRQRWNLLFERKLS